MLTDYHQNYIRAKAKHMYLATEFSLGYDQYWYKKFIENLENYHLQGKYDYPKILVLAYNILSNCKNNPKNVIRPVNGGVAFFNTEER